MADHVVRASAKRFARVIADYGNCASAMLELERLADYNPGHRLRLLKSPTADLPNTREIVHDSAVSPGTAFGSDRGMTDFVILVCTLAGAAAYFMSAEERRRSMAAGVA